MGLDASDFQTARRLAQVNNQRFGEGSPRALDGRTVKVSAPAEPDTRIAFIADIEELTLETSIPAAKVIINARTGSVVLNQAVTLGPCAVATEKTNIQIKQEPGNLILLPASPLLADVVRALNALGATPQDLLAILQAIKAAGALNAELAVI